MSAWIAFALALGAPGSFDRAMLESRHCPSETSWVEQTRPGVWAAVCGDAAGNPLRCVATDAVSAYCAPAEPSSCERMAELAWFVARAEGSDPDEAWEDTIADCTP